jgi:hypothetical protein
VGVRRSMSSSVDWRAQRMTSEGVEMAMHHWTDGLNTPIDDAVCGELDMKLSRIKHAIDRS